MNRIEPKTHCNDQSLRLLLESDQPQHITAELEQHLSQCLACQRRIEELAADAWWWKDGSRLIESGSEIEDGQETIHQDELEITEFKKLREKQAFEMLDAPSHPEMLGRIGKYDIERLVGWGGMGVVFKGFDTDLNRVVAIKLLAPHLASSVAARKRFTREARAAAAIVHENVIAIHGICSEDRVPYIVMPFVGGLSLHNHVNESGYLETKESIRIAIQICSGLSAAHEHGLVHRDVKPANILLENGCNRVLIGDFGLARAADDATLTRTGLVAGTPEYMSPEQADGIGISYQSDLFSLGAVIYFMLAGRSPFKADGAMAVLKRICDTSHVPLCELNPEVPKVVSEIVDRLLQKKPEHRFESADETRTVLTECLAHLQQPATQDAPVIEAISPSDFPTEEESETLTVIPEQKLMIPISINQSEKGRASSSILMTGLFVSGIMFALFSGLFALAIFWYLSNDLPPAATFTVPGNSTSAVSSSNVFPKTRLMSSDELDQEIVSIESEISRLESAFGAATPAQPILQKQTEWNRTLESIERLETESLDE